MLEIVLVVLVAILVCRRFPNILSARVFQLKLRDLPRRFSLQSLSQLCTAVAVLAATNSVFGALAAVVAATAILVATLRGL